MHPLAERLDKILQAKPHPTSLKFYEELVGCAELHAAKQQDYGREHDPFANIRASEEIGIPADKGAWLRGKDKVKRIDKYHIDGKLANESVLDSLRDLAVYSLIGATLLKERIEQESVR